MLLETFERACFRATDSFSAFVVIVTMSAVCVYATAMMIYAIMTACDLSLSSLGARPAGRCQFVIWM